MDREKRMARIRPKMERGIVQVKYQSRLIGLHSGRALCMGCDEPITQPMCVGYSSVAGVHHWFHLGCDAVRRTIAAQLLREKVHRWINRRTLR